MKTLLRHILLLLLLSAPLWARADRTALITDAAQLSANPEFTDNLSNLMDLNATTHCHWPTTGIGTDGNYLQVALNSPLDLNPSGANPLDLVVCVVRGSSTGASTADQQGNPTAFQVLGGIEQTDGTITWEPFCHLYFLDRGFNTLEYSERVRTDRPFTHLRFVVKDNNYHNHDSADHFFLGMAGFQIYTLERTDLYDADTYRKDNFYYTFDYHRVNFSAAAPPTVPAPANIASQIDLNDANITRFSNCTFVNTMGVYDPINRPEAHSNWTSLGLTNYLSDWDACFDSNGKWQKDLQYLQEHGITPPDNSLVTSASTDYDYIPAAGQVRQRAHIIDHDVQYAIPGEAIVLQPFYTFRLGSPGAGNEWQYNERFMHWYDYTNGGIPKASIGIDATETVEKDALGFLIDATNIAKNETYGYFAGPAVSSVETDKSRLDFRRPGTTATFMIPRDPMDGGTLQSLPMPAGQTEYIIACDLSQNIETNRHCPATTTDGDGNEVENTVFKEPIIAIRHIFHIRDGKQFAEEFSGSHAANVAYVRKNARHLSGPAGTKFQFRLNALAPCSQYVPSKYYYKTQNGNYRRVYRMELKVYNAETMEDVTSSNLFQFDDGFRAVGEGSRMVNGVEYRLNGGHTERVKNDRMYYRMIKSTSDTPVAGHWLIRLIGYDAKDTKIQVYGSTEDLIVQEFDVTLLPQGSASILTQDQLYSEDNAFEHARDGYLRTNYGTPKDSVDFDQYRYLTKLSNIEDYIGKRARYQYDWNSGYGTTLPEGYLKWPLDWHTCSYAFCYDHAGNYNSYRLVNSSSAAPWHSKVSGTLYDRLYYKTLLNYPDDTSKQEKGFFYFVNAAEDPGTIAKLSVKDLCKGSTVYVSAWYSDFSGGGGFAKGNMIFNFNAVMSGTGEKVQLHSFVTGEPPTSGVWYNVYYSFVPQFTAVGINPDDVDHYELELESNCQSSYGADYAVDDIRLFSVRPQVFASQTSAMCAATDHATTVKVETSFEAALQLLGLTEATETASAQTGRIYYTYIDYDIFNQKYLEYLNAGDFTNAGLRAYDDAVLKYKYMSGVEDNDQTYGYLTFKTNFTDNTTFDGGKNVTASVFGETTDGQRMLVFSTNPNSTTFKTGQTYYLSLAFGLDGETDVDGNPFVPGWSDFDVKNSCGKYTVFHVQAPSIIKIDGTQVSDPSAIEACENQSPVAQVNLWGITSSGDMMEFEHDAMLDWFIGSYNELINLTVPAQFSGARQAYDLLKVFRNEYPTAETANVAPKGQLTTQDIAYLKYLTTQIDPTKGYCLVQLAQTSYVFPPGTYDERATGENDNMMVATCLPTVLEREITGGTLRVCEQPTEVRIHLRRHAPHIRDGVYHDIPYPEKMFDVPVRLGMRQLNKALVDPSITAADLATHETLCIPIRSVIHTGKLHDGDAMTVDADHNQIFLAETNDPEYADLGLKTDNAGSLMAVGEVTSVTAAFDNSSEATNRLKNFTAVFYNTFHFREGYYYRMRFDFMENGTMETQVVDGVTDEEGNQVEEDIICNGQAVFTLKIVPYYQKWTGLAGDGNSNWNNDANWSRIEATDVLTSANWKEENVEYEHVPNKVIKIRWQDDESRYMIDDQPGGYSSIRLSQASSEYSNWELIPSQLHADKYYIRNTKSGRYFGTTNGSPVNLSVTPVEYYVKLRENDTDSRNGYYWFSSTDHNNYYLKTNANDNALNTNSTLWQADRWNCATDGSCWAIMVQDDVEPYDHTNDIKKNKIFKIMARHTDGRTIYDAGADAWIQVTSDASTSTIYWEFIPSPNGENRYYIRNTKTGRYLGSTNIGTSGVNVKPSTTPVEYYLGVYPTGNNTSLFWFASTDTDDFGLNNEHSLNIRGTTSYICRWNAGSGNDYSFWRLVEAPDGIEPYNDNPTPTQEVDEEFIAKHHFVNEYNSSRTTYAPLDFTKVVIPGKGELAAGASFPTLPPYPTTTDFTANYVGSTNPDGTTDVNWVRHINDAGIGVATDSIQYDMTLYPGDNGFKCRPYRHNTCGEIHMNVNSELLGQQNLVYDKAWADFVNTPGRWYTLASPLQCVYAGDMYAPHKTANQNSPYFEDITFDEGIYDRYSPAVFQRSWDNGSALVYTRDQSTESSVVKLKWSRVYNDVQVSYGAGHGFSIKSDLDIKDDINASEIRFRLPKADTEYNYFDLGGSGTAWSHTLDKTTADASGLRTGQHRFQPVSGTVTLINGASSQYFLVGNPFMAHLDMQAFLAANSSKIEQKYWIVTDGMQQVGSFTDDNKTGGASGTVAPFQGFFVKSLTTSPLLDLTYNETMMTTADFSATNALRAPAAREAEPLRITAARRGHVSSEAIVILREDASAAFGQEDVELLDNSDLDIIPAVYTMAGTMAASVNATPTANGLEIGLIAPEEETSLLTFTGVEAIGDELQLYDADSGEYTELTEGMTYEVKGPATARLFLRAPAAIDRGSLSISVRGRQVTVVSPLEDAAIRAGLYNVQGIQMGGIDVDEPVARFSIPDAGFFIITATDGTETRTIKVIVE